MITFQQIHKIGHVIEDNDQYKQVHYPKMLSRYDSNFVEWKQVPSLAAFTIVEQQLKEFHVQHGQKHVKFIFPQQEKIPTSLQDYLLQQQYSISFMELYSIEPSAFQVEKKTHVALSFVNEQNEDAFLALMYNEDLQFGEVYAQEKQQLLRHLQRTEGHFQVVASVDGQAVGALLLIENEQTVEIDNLFVIEQLQRQGIGSQLQLFVMEHFPTKRVILVADGEDTAKDMYKKQGYYYHGFQYEALQVKQD